MRIIIKDIEKEKEDLLIDRDRVFEFEIPNGVKLRIRNLTTHQFHLVDSSQIPIITAISAMLLVLSIIFR
jgi:hypothetical protein